MPVVSVSLTEKNMKTLEKVSESLGLVSRSEAIRACLRSAEAEMRNRESLHGEVEGILVTVHDSHASSELDEARHEFQDIVTTQIHSHLKSRKCLEVFILQGKADKVKALLRTFRAAEMLEYVKFVQS